MSKAQKGGVFERDIARKLTIWASGRPMPLLYWRSSGSGAQATRTGDTKSNMVGDIMPLVPEAYFLTDIFVIECKDRKNVDVLDFIEKSDSDNIFQWWRDVQFLCMGTKRQPLLIFHRYKSSHDYCCIARPVWSQLVSFMMYIEEKGPDRGRLDVLNNGGIIIVNFEKFLDWIRPWELARVLLGVKKGKEVKANYNE